MKILMERKKVIEDIKKVRKPIQKVELEEHAKKYEELLEGKLK